MSLNILRACSAWDHLPLSYKAVQKQLKLINIVLTENNTGIGYTQYVTIASLLRVADEHSGEHSLNQANM